MDSFMFLDTNDFASSLMLVGLLFFVGRRVAHCDAVARRWGEAAGCLVLAVTVCRGASPDEDLAEAVRRGILAAGFVTGVSWLTLPTARAAYARTTGAMRSAAIERERRMEQREAARRQADDEARRRSQQPTPEQLAEERKRQQRAAAAEASARRSRENARMDCELLYALYAPEIAKRLPRKMFDAFVAKYMGDDRPPDEVEDRARQLREIVLQHHEKIRPTPRFSNLAELGAWYAAEKQRIDELPVDGQFRQQHIVQLNMRYVELTEQLMEKL